MDSLKRVGNVVLSLLAYCAIALAIGFFVMGGVWFAAKVYPLATAATGYTLLIAVVVLLPMLIIRRSRPWAGVGLYLASFVFGFNCWLFCFILTYQTLGTFGLIFGLLLLGLGVVPLALIGAIWKQLWPNLWDVLLLAGLTLGARALGLAIVYMHERRKDLPDCSAGGVFGSQQESATLAGHIGPQTPVQGDIGNTYPRSLSARLGDAMARGDDTECKSLLNALKDQDLDAGAEDEEGTSPEQSLYDETLNSLAPSHQRILGRYPQLKEFLDELEDLRGKYAAAKCKNDEWNDWARGNCDFDHNATYSEVVLTHELKEAQTLLAEAQLRLAVLERRITYAERLRAAWLWVGTAWPFRLLSFLGHRVAEPFRPLVAWGQRSQIWGSLGLTLFALLTVGVLLADVARHHNSASEAYRRDVVSTLNQAGLACPEPSVGLTFSEEIVEDVAKSNLFSYAEQYRTSSYVRTPLLKSSLYFSRIVSHHHAPILHFLGLDSLKWEIERREVREKPGGCIVNLKEQRAASPGRMPCGVLTLKDFFLEGK